MHHVLAYRMFQVLSDLLDAGGKGGKTNIMSYGMHNSVLSSYLDNVELSHRKKDCDNANKKANLPH